MIKASFVLGLHTYGTSALAHDADLLGRNMTFAKNLQGTSADEEGRGQLD